MAAERVVPQLVCLLAFLTRSPCCSRPHVLIVLADDLGWQDVGFHGGDVQTPNLDALAYHGVSLRRHYSEPSCTPSRAALLTGDYPIRHGLEGRPAVAPCADGLPTNVKILPQYFSELGYKTHLIGKWHLGFETKAHTPNRRGFDTFFGFYNGHIGYWDGVHQTRSGEVGLDFRRGGEGAWEEAYGHYLTEVLTREAVRQVEQHDPASSLLLVLSHAAVHTSFRPMAREAPPRTADLTRRGVLREMVRWLDWSVGEVVEAMSRSHLLNNSIIVFLSDNGAPSVKSYPNAGSNWPLRGQKLSPHEGGVRTPAIVWSSLFKLTSRVTDQLFHITDWLPTLYSAVGGEIKNLKSHDGLNQWKSLFIGSNGSRNDALINIDGWTKTESYLEGNWKIVKNFLPDHNMSIANNYFGNSSRWYTYDPSLVKNSPVGRILGGIPENWQVLQATASVEPRCSQEQRLAAEKTDCHSRYCLFNIFEDPEECQDLANQNSDIVEKLKGKLDFFRKISRPGKSTQCTMEDNPRAHPKYHHNYWAPWL